MICCLGTDKTALTRLKTPSFHGFSGSSNIMATRSFAQLKTVKDLTKTELDFLKERCYDSYEVVDGHFLYKGRDGADYAKVRLKLRGIDYLLGRHQLALYLKLIDDEYDISSWGPTEETSHLCHKRRCFNPSHLVLEDRSKNKERDHCVAERKCRGHGSSPLCMI